MKPKKRDTSKKRVSILDAAIDAFQTLGFDNTSMDYIAERAGASKRTVYNHFPSKEVLFKGVLNRFIDDITTRKQITYSKEMPLEDQLEKFIDAKMYVTQDAAWLGFMKVTLGVHIARPELVVEAMTRAEESENTLRIWLEAAVDDGRLKVENPARAASIFCAMISGTFLWPTLLKGPIEPKEARELKEEIVSMFLARYALGW